MKKLTVIIIVLLAAATSQAFERGDISITAERLMARMEAKIDQSTKSASQSDQKTHESLCKHHDSKEAGCC